MGTFEAKNILHRQESLEQAQCVLRDAWLLHLESNTMNDVVETNTIKKLQKLYQEKNFSQVMK
jgi:hypothetical protein